MRYIFSPAHSGKQKGFTLLEVVIALTIMAVLMVAATQSIQQGLRAKVKIQDQIDDMSKVRDTLRIIEKDVNLAFHYRDIELEFLAEVACKNKPATQTQPQLLDPLTGVPIGQPQAQSSSGSSDKTQTCINNYKNDAKNKEKFQNRKDPTTQFVGENERLDFATNNVSRISEREIIADFAKVGYSLRPCKKLSGENAGQCLVRRLAGIVEGDVTKGGEETVLLENVTEFKLRYFGKGKQDWVNSWSSLANDGATKDNFPQAVEVSLILEIPKGADGKSKKKISMQIVAAVRNPNNLEKDSTSSSGSPNAL